MKTQKKELPNEFTFICDKHSREQLEKLGVELNGFSVREINCEYLVRNKNVVSCIDGRFNQKDLILIFFSDYIDQPTEQKWEDKTRGGFQYHIYEEFEGNIYGRVKSDNYNCYISMMWDSNGKYFGNPDTGRCFDLIPKNPRLTEIQNRLAEIEAEREKLNEELEQLNK